MRSACRIRSLALLFVLTSVTAVAGSFSNQLNEPEMRAIISDKEIRLDVPVTSNGIGAVPGAVFVELLDQNDAVATEGHAAAELKPGRNLLSVVLARPGTRPNEEPDQVLWYRVRYRLEIEGKETGHGIVALGAIAPDMFDVRIANAEKVLPDHPYRVRVHAANPVTRKPVSGVLVRGEISFDQGGDSASITRTTNAAGEALLTFHVPSSVNEGGSVKIELHKQGEIRKEEFDFDLDSRARVIINTDKLLYQPGQPLHARALALTVDKHAIANEELEFTLVDPESNTAFRSTAKTNEFGIASIDWDLPDAIELGPYHLKVAFSDSGRFSDVTEWTNVRVSRYDLPNFTVSAKPDRGYYLPGQQASVEIAAKYLFGKELKRGSVKLVRQEEGHWDSAQRKRVVDESDQKSAELDSSGKAEFKLDLSEFHAELGNETYRRFRDLNYAAYVTDPSTGRTEQRRFHVRLTRQPIHIYVAANRVRGNQASFYLSTYYADGSPAECQVEISQLQDRDANDTVGDSRTRREFLRKIKTNRYGVAKVADLPLVSEPGGDNDRYHSRQLRFDVRDKNGVTAWHEEGIWDAADKWIDVTTDKTLYKENEQILVSVRGSAAVSGRVILELGRDGAVLWTGQVGLRNHRGFTLVPYSPEWKGELTVLAYSLENESDNRYDIPAGVRAILFPHPSTLNVKVKTDRTTYKPGEDVSAALNVSLPGGSSAASALGVVVVDKAVEERIRTDEEFGDGHYGFWDWDWWYPGDSVGGVTRKDLEELDLSEPLPDGMDLVAEMLLQSPGYSWAALPEIEGNGYSAVTMQLYDGKMRRDLEAVRKALLDEGREGWKFPTNNDEFAAVLQGAKIDPQEIVDPWGTAYRSSFGLEYRHRTVHLMSAGPDKKFGTADDLEPVAVNWPYFEATGKLIDRVVKETYATSGEYIRDVETLTTRMRLRGVDLKTLRDPWGNPYKISFNTSQSLFQIVVESGAAKSKQGYSWPFSVWTSSIDYFADVRAKIDRAIADYAGRTGSFPQDDETFEKAMAGSDVRLNKLADPWGNPYYVSYGIDSRYSDSTKITYRPDARVQNGTPVTLKMAWVRIVSAGADGKPHTSDDFAVANFERVVSEQSGQDLVARPVASVPLIGNTGAINGVVTDQTGAVVANVTVTAEMRETGRKFVTATDANGAYIIRNLAPGIYDVTVTAAGFTKAQVMTVPVHSSSLTAVNVMLRLGAAMETVEVQAGAVELSTQASMSAVVAKSMGGTKVQVREETFTPRLRSFFPETLFWAPSVITDRSGRTRLKFKLADNITMWKMSVLASTKNGEIGEAESEIQAFQPFFLEHDPPKVLTVGDVIDLPVVVRNYLPQTQKIGIEMKPAGWYELGRPGKQEISVEAGDARAAVFPFRAISTVKAGRQQVYAANHSTGDAVEKTISVHPDGLPQSASVASILRGDTTLKVTVPADVVAGGTRAQLKVYPNILAHVTESIEAGLERPYGCGEQTISSTYPSLLLLEYYRSGAVTNTSLQNRATRYLNLGYRRLLNYREPSGGFSYWGHDGADAALTAYAIRFLSDASVFMEVDPEIITAAEKWLVSQQTGEGTWKIKYGHDYEDLTAYVAATLAKSEKQAKEPLKKALHESVARALAFLSDPHLDMSEPYALAEFAIAATESGDKKSAMVAVEKLAKMATPEQGGVYWALERNTPFYGWGHTGRIESTAITVLALSAVDSIGLRKLIDSGIFWLLQQKDRYGVWYSGQTTVNVLNALLEIDTSTANGKTIRVVPTINGKAMPEIELNPRSDAPSVVDISDLIRPGENTIALGNSGELGQASMQAVADYYVPWKGESAAEATRPGLREGLRLAVSYDKTDARVGDEVRCSVEAERIGSSGWGMMIAEIGLPPGAEVDRRALDDVINNSGWTISHYDVQPDRLVLYLWPRAGGTKLSFTLRPRYGLKARTAPSELYDYYNPEAEVSLAPTDFVVQRAQPELKLAAAKP